MAGADGGRGGIELHRQGLTLGVEIHAIGVDERERIARALAERRTGGSLGDHGRFHELGRDTCRLVAENPRGQQRLLDVGAASSPRLLERQHRRGDVGLGAQPGGGVAQPERQVDRDAGRAGIEARGALVAARGRQGRAAQRPFGRRCALALLEPCRRGAHVSPLLDGRCHVGRAHRRHRRHHHALGQGRAVLPDEHAERQRALAEVQVRPHMGHARAGLLGLELPQVALRGHAFRHASPHQLHDLLDGPPMDGQQASGLARPRDTQVRIDHREVHATPLRVDFLHEVRA
jgi:hypothetical protein